MRSTCTTPHKIENGITAEYTACVENALHAFGGGVEMVYLDNLKAGITRACFVDPEVNAVFSALARHYGFAAVPIHWGSLWAS